MTIKEPIALMFPAEQQCLQKWATGCKHIVELGVAYGGTSLLLHKAAADNAHLTLIDPFDGYPMTYHGEVIQGDRTLAHAAIDSVHGTKNVTCRWIEKPSVSAADDVPDGIDFLLIDACHDAPYPMQDWLAWKDKIAPGGRVAFHDVAGGYPGVLSAYMRANQGGEWREIAHENSLRILERCPETTSWKPSVLLTTAAFGGLSWGGYPAALAHTTAALTASERKWDFAGVANIPYMTEVRNIMGNHFLQHTDFDLLAVIDADLSWDANDFLNMLALIDPTHQVVGGLYPHKVIQWESVHRAVLAGVPAEDLFRVAGKYGVNAEPHVAAFKQGDLLPARRLHGGFTLMTRQALTALAKARKDYWYVQALLPRTDPYWVEQTVQLWHIDINDQHQLVTEDFLICEDFKRLGYQSWLDTRPQIIHCGTIAFRGELTPSLKYNQPQDPPDTKGSTP